MIGGLSHPSTREIHGHWTADPFLTGASTGAFGEYQNTVSLDQVFAAKSGEQTRKVSLVLSAGGGLGTPR